MKTELAKDFNYILYYFGIKTKVYEPANRCVVHNRGNLALRGWHWENGHGMFYFLYTPFLEKNVYLALDEMCLTFQEIIDKPQYYGGAHNKIKYYK